MGFPRKERAEGIAWRKGGRHFPPKYTISLAHEFATGKFLDPDRFHGGAESNGFLKRLGFSVIPCGCGGGEAGDRPPSPPRPEKRVKARGNSVRHDEHCADCKARVREMLERIYGECHVNHQFGWRADLPGYVDTPIGGILQNVAKAVQSYRGYGVDDFVKNPKLSGCDFWVPDPGFIVEFDEGQHFTHPRKLALSAYANDSPLGFSAKRWITLCEEKNRKDSNPVYRDEQRAWYDTLRDLVPPIKDLRATVRLNASDQIWCSLNPSRAEDRAHFLRLMPHRPSGQPTPCFQKAPARDSASPLRAAIVFPHAQKESKHGIPPSGAEAQQPQVPDATSFAGEPVDFVFFPEAYIRTDDDARKSTLRKLASELAAPLLVGAIDNRLGDSGRDSQVLLRFGPDGSTPIHLYAKHSTSPAIAFGQPEWEPCDALPVFDLCGITAGATICHDHYLGLLPRFLADQGARLWVNPSYDNVTDIKWSSILRLRAVENRFFSLCTLHCDATRRKTHPFGFSPDGTELSAREAGSSVARPLSECNEAGIIYLVELDMEVANKPLDWATIPCAKKPRRPRDGTPIKPIHLGMRDGRPVVLGYSGWEPRQRVETDSGPIYLRMMRGEQILDSAACFRVIDQARQENRAPILWFHWKRLPTESARLATLMMGRAIECCAPIVVSDEDGIAELVELANNYKYPVRRAVSTCGEVVADIHHARGLDSAFKMVESHLPAKMRQCALDRYRSLA